jgi:hypothetical protein
MIMLPLEMPLDPAPLDPAPLDPATALLNPGLWGLLRPSTLVCSHSHSILHFLSANAIFDYAPCRDMFE